MIKEESKNKVLKIYDFYLLFLKTKRLFDVVYFFFPINTRKKKIAISRPLHKKIISTYLDIYFNEFYYQKRPKYFMLSGRLMKAKSIKHIVHLENGTFKESNGISWIWFNRPSEAFHSNVKMVKMKGSTSRVGRLDKKYKEDNDLETLETTKSVLDRLLKQRKFFIR